MGSRSNIVVDFGEKKSKQRIFLYSHWGGPDMALHLRDACKAGVRADDPSYFARIVFDRMIGKSQGEETGYGISPMITDNQYNLLVVNCAMGKVWAEKEDGTKVGPCVTIAEFGALGDDEAREFMTRE